MNNPFEDLEYLAEFLPEEGESVIVSRRKGQLICESYLEPMTSAPSSGVIDRELYGRLVTINARLRFVWQIPVLSAAIACYWVCLVLQHFFVLNALYSFGLALTMVIGCYYYAEYRQRKFFLKVVCPVLQKWMHEHQLEKYSLIAWLTTQRQLSTLRKCFALWT